MVYVINMNNIKNIINILHFHNIIYFHLILQFFECFLILALQNFIYRHLHNHFHFLRNLKVIQIHFQHLFYQVKMINNTFFLIL